MGQNWCIKRHLIPEITGLLPPENLISLIRIKMIKIIFLQNY